MLLIVENTATGVHQDDESNVATKKTTADGTIILEPQPNDSSNDPLNWPRWRRDAALFSLGLYCMIGGGITPLLAAGFTEISREYNVPVTDVSLTTGLIMLGLGVGCVLVSPVAIIYGKRPVYLGSAILCLLTAVWCALSPSFTSLLLARVVQGIAVSPIEALASASIAEMFFLHELAFRIGIYGLMLLGGKNLVPLVGAAIINKLGWRWVFWVVTMVVGFFGLLLFFFHPETFWDRTPTKEESTPSDHLYQHAILSEAFCEKPPPSGSGQELERTVTESQGVPEATPTAPQSKVDVPLDSAESSLAAAAIMFEETKRTTSYPIGLVDSESPDSEEGKRRSIPAVLGSNAYMQRMKSTPKESFTSQLRPWHGRLRHEERWLQVACRPFLLFAYPAILWSATVYSCCIGWLIVISESMDIIYRSSGIYHFTALQTGLVYVSPFVGGVLGTAVAGKLSDMVVRSMARRNGGMYEPEFRLVMAIPVAICTVLGLMGFGWSAQDRDDWIVPTVFFGIISFGCAL